MRKVLCGALQGTEPGNEPGAELGAAVGAEPVTNRCRTGVCVVPPYPYVLPPLDVGRRTWAKRQVQKRDVLARYCHHSELTHGLGRTLTPVTTGHTNPGGGRVPRQPDPRAPAHLSTVAEPVGTLPLAHLNPGCASVQRQPDPRAAASHASSTSLSADLSSNPGGGLVHRLPAPRAPAPLSTVPEPAGTTSLAHLNPGGVNWVARQPVPRATVCSLSASSSAGALHLPRVPRPFRFDGAPIRQTRLFYLRFSAPSREIHKRSHTRL
jgi:hypothetical protein